ncbi:MAG: hypothetical protein GOV02_01325, partial [Candidatus Aenigmarchaeota archaeon]|nr:hypothetical protein [Candidatus Aenigmarchaeota archaeon]
MTGPTSKKMRKELKNFCSDHVCTAVGGANPCPIYDFSDKHEDNDALHYCYFDDSDY